MAIIPAFVVFLLCTWFTWLVARQYRRNHKDSHLFWMISLAASALASLSYFLTLCTQPHNSLCFLSYYVLGALWMPALMGLGSLSLLFSRRAVVSVASAVAAVGVVGTVMMVTQPLSFQTLQQLQGGAGTGIIEQGLWLVPLILMSTFGALAVFVVALVSAWRAFRQHVHDRFLHGNLCLACGILIISLAGTAARLGWPQVFWLVMLVGWVVTFVGYQLLTPKPVIVSVAAERTEA